MSTSDANAVHKVVAHDATALVAALEGSSIYHDKAEIDTDTSKDPIFWIDTKAAVAEAVDLLDTLRVYPPFPLYRPRRCQSLS